VSCGNPDFSVAENALKMPWMKELAQKENARGERAFSV
jgi:hypothetical protein